MLAHGGGCLHKEGVGLFWGKQLFPSVEPINEEGGDVVARERMVTP